MLTFKHIFSGLFLVFIDIHLGSIDILPDFLGFFIVYGALNKLGGDLFRKKWAVNFALALAALSIPQMFLGQAASPMVQSYAMDGLALYYHTLGILKLVFMFFLFQVLLDQAKKLGDDLLFKRTRYIYMAYLYTQLIYYAVLPWMINLPDHIAMPFTVLGIGAVLIVELSALAIVWAFHKGNSQPIPE